MKTLFHKNLKPVDNRPQRHGWGPGDYIGMVCRICGATFQGDKRAYECADCAYAKPEFYRPPSIDRLEQVTLKECPVCGCKSPELIDGYYVKCLVKTCEMIGPKNDPHGHKWNSIPRRSEVRELLRLIDEVLRWDQNENAWMDLDELTKYISKLRKEWNL